MRFIFSLCLFLAACSPNTTVSVGGIEVSTALRQAAQTQHFDYTGLLAKSLDGDASALEKLLLFEVDSTHFQAHGQVLSGMLASLGDESLAKIIATLDAGDRRRIWAAMEAGAPAPLKTTAPKTLAALFPPKNSEEYRGLYVYSHRQSTFRDCAEPEARYAVIDETGALEKNYRRLLRYPYPGQPIFAEVKGYKTAYFSNRSLPANLSGFFIVTEILDLEAKNYRNTCIPYDFWGLGNEPFWQAQISAEEALIEFRAMDDDATTVFTYQPPVEEDSARVYAAFNDDTGDNIRIVVKEEICSDGMSDIRYPYKIELTVNGKDFSGCGIPYSEGRDTLQKIQE